MTRLVCENCFATAPVGTTFCPECGECMETDDKDDDSSDGESDEPSSDDEDRVSQTPRPTSGALTKLSKEQLRSLLDTSFVRIGQTEVRATGLVTESSDI